MQRVRFIIDMFDILLFVCIYNGAQKRIKCIVVFIEEKKNVGNGFHLEKDYTN